ncbi:MAG: MTH938/NDUFAF3 family protein [Desulfobacula sp.]|uniref:MTH938/NDUFAF3 family protein n=1 Tax=Desulfobacula sp. TaxID=2593537 RepID=UPI0025C396CA|nr:MTH938/NDUFAF3 family protein [Desulfobacula sp.]MCD4719709.1 MTH938/NDUFAF3 family protein [Desulfobacula sp.]
MMPMPNIDAYQFGRMIINGKPFTTDLIILSSGIVIDNWIRKTGHFLEYNDIKALISAEPEDIIIGTGASGRMQVDENLLSLFDRLTINVDIDSNKRAVELYNQKIKINRKVGACFHLTC